MSTTAQSSAVQTPNSFVIICLLVLLSRFFGVVAFVRCGGSALHGSVGAGHVEALPMLVATGRLRFPFVATTPRSYRQPPGRSTISTEAHVRVFDLRGQANHSRFPNRRGTTTPDSQERSHEGDE